MRSLHSGCTKSINARFIKRINGPKPEHTGTSGIDQFNQALSAYANKVRRQFNKVMKIIFCFFVMRIVSGLRYITKRIKNDPCGFVDVRRV